MLRRAFPGGPEAKALPSNPGGAGLISGQGARIPHASQPKKTKYKNRSNIVTNLIKIFFKKASE